MSENGGAGNAKVAFPRGPQRFTDRPGGRGQWGERVEGFTAQQATRLTGCTPHQLRYWDKVALVEPSLQQTGGRPGRRRLYSFRDLIALRVVKSLLDNGMSIQRVRRAWDYLRRTGDMETHLAEIRLVTDGETIFAVATDEDEVLDALRQGQLAFFVAINDITQTVEDDVSRFELDRERFLEMLRRVEDDVQMEVEEAGG